MVQPMITGLLKLANSKLIALVAASRDVSGRSIVLIDCRPDQHNFPIA